jgi:hypothetical protein
LAGPAIDHGPGALAVTNSGTLRGSGALAVDLGGGDDSLTLGTGSILVGDAEGGPGDDLLRLRGRGTQDGDAFLGFERLEVTGGDQALTGDLVLATLDGPGTARVTGGRLRVNGTLTAPGGVKVTVPGILGGTGEVVGMVDNMGTIAPGNSVGTIKVTGDVTFAPGSVLEIEADATGWRSWATSASTRRRPSI